LRAQLQPHFLFNTLNALAELVHADPHLAESLLLRLSQLLRRALDGDGQRRVTLREELDFLDDYLAIQHALFGERLQLRRDVDARALDAQLPPMLLQPLVENALRHGLGPRREGGTLSLSARLTPDGLVFEVADDGVGIRGGLVEGVGLRNTRERLSTEFGADASLQVESAPGEGCRVSLTVPQAAA
jgi:LytS/YehU family sensor histidine kinase